VFGMGLAIARARREIARQQELGSYRLEHRLGKGGMGEVWRASHGMLARPAAIKLIRPAAMERARGIAPDRADAMLKRFEREAQVTATLTSHHTVQIYDFGRTLDGSFYYVMELLEGLDLETLVREHGPLPAERAAFLLLQICHSLADAHSRGLIHRDVKPANIYVCNKGLDFDFVKVLDFGLVALQSELSGEDVRLTAEGNVAGTPAYMAPELAAEGAEVDARADLYALGCVAYWMLAGRLVFEGETAVGVIVAHASREPTPPSRVSEVEIPAALEAVVLACLAKAPDDRPASATALALALERTGLPQRWSEERARAWWIAHSPGALPGPVSAPSLGGASMAGR